MQRFFHAAVAGTLLAAPVHAATMVASARLDTQSPGQRVTDASHAETQLLGLPGFQDTGIDEGRASADLVSGKLRFLARDGRQTDPVTVYEIGSGTSAAASIEETLTFSTSPTMTSYTTMLGIDFEASYSAFAGGFGQFQENPGIGGLQGAFASFTYGITQTNPQPNGSVRTNRSFGSASHGASALVSFPPTETTYQVVPQAVFIQPLVEFGPDTSDPNNPTIVTDVRTIVTGRSEAYFSGRIEIDLLITGTHTFTFLGEASGRATGGAGTYAGVSSLNTASLFVDAPAGAIWSSESGLFLTGLDSAPATVPLPASGLFLAGAGGVLLIVRKLRSRRDSAA